MDKKIWLWSEIISQIAYLEPEFIMTKNNKFILSQSTSFEQQRSQNSEFLNYK